MTFPDRRLDRPLEPPEVRSENVQDVIPPHERNQDPQRSTHNLVNESSRPERQAAASSATATFASQSHEEPSFARVPRPSNNPGSSETPKPQRWMSSSPAIGSMLVPMSVGWAAVGIGSGVAIWLWMRWRRERNKPINRIRRQARQTAQQARHTASELRDRVPDLPDEATRPAMGLGTALVSLGILVWQFQARSRSRRSTSTREAQRRAQKASKQARGMTRKAGKQAAETLSDVDWQSRLMQLKELWSPARIELEKRSVPKR